MSNTPIDDWASLSDAWREDSSQIVGVDELRARVGRQTRRLLLITAFEILLTLGALAVIGVGVAKSPTLETRLLASGLLLFTAVIWTFTICNRRGIWRAAGDSSVAYRALERTRLQRRISAARFTWRLCSIALLPMVVLVVHNVRSPGASSLEAVVALGGLSYLSAWIVGARWLEARLMARAQAMGSEEA